MFDAQAAVRTPVTHLAPKAQSVPDLFLRRVAASNDRKAFQYKRDGRWIDVSWGEFGRTAQALAQALIDHEISPGDKITILGSTRPEWCYCDLAGMLAGAVTVGAYPSLAPPQLQYLLDHSDTKICFVESAAELEKVIAVWDDLPKLQLAVVWDPDTLQDAHRNDARIFELQNWLNTRPDEDRIRERVGAINPDDTAILVYTSGTTGPPKGAMISHTNILTILGDAKNLTPFDADDISLSFLPMAHVAERIMAFYGRIDSGIATAYASSIPAVLEELQEVRPTIFGSVPRIYEKAYGRIMGEVDKAPARRQKIFRWAERVGREAVHRWQRGEPLPLGLKLQYRLASKLVFSKIRAAFGGRVRFSVTGAAPIAYEILVFFWAAGIPIYEVYGMTEATVVTHGNRPGAVKLGTVGKPLAFIEDKIADDGEVLVRGRTVFQGYYKNDEATRESIHDGWLHTGDIGRKDEDGFLRILDRKKHIIITAGGKNLTPANIENEIKNEDALISQVHVHGDRRPYLIAMLTIHPNEAIEWAMEQGLVEDRAQAEALLKELTANPLARPPELAPLLEKVANHPRVRERFVAAVERANQRLAKVETIKRIYVLPRDFSLEEHEVTPTLKVKRKEIERKFAEQFDRVYADEAFGIPVEVQ